MNDETLKAIELIANKLGVAAEYLLGVMIKQAPISAAIVVMNIALCALVGFALSKAVSYASKRHSKYGYGDELSIIIYVACGISFAILAAFTICAVSNIGDAITALLNPEYWALMQILDR